MVTTVTKYIGYLEEAFALEPVKLHSTKAKREIDFIAVTRKQKILHSGGLFGCGRKKGANVNSAHSRILITQFKKL